MKRLVRLFSFNSFVWVALAVGLVLAVLLARDGLGALDGLGLALYAAAAVAARQALRTPAGRLARFDALAAFDRVLLDNRPTLLEFYSDNCGVCMAMRPVLDRLEHDAANRLQILRIDVKDPTGAQIANRYNVNFTPSFLLFNSLGIMEEEYTLMLDRSRVLYWLDQQTISP